jgi:hypothetical protein
MTETPRMRPFVFVCEECGFEIKMDYDGNVGEAIPCESCDGDMIGALKLPGKPPTPHRF